MRSIKLDWRLWPRSWSRLATGVGSFKGHFHIVNKNTLEKSLYAVHVDPSMTITMTMTTGDEDTRQKEKKKQGEFALGKQCQ